MSVNDSIAVLERAAATFDTLGPLIAEHLKLHEQSLELRHLAKLLEEAQSLEAMPSVPDAQRITRSMLLAGMDAAHAEGIRITFSFLSKLFTAMASAQPVKH